MADMTFARPRRVFVYRECSERQGQLMGAFAKASGEFLPVERDTKAEWGWFASLKSMKRSTTAALAKHELAVWHEEAEIDGKPYLVCIMGHSSGEWTSYVKALKVTGDTDADLAYLTKMRRVTYAAILCLAPEDEPEATETSESKDDENAKARAAAWAEQQRLAKDAIAAATTTKRLDEIVAKVKAKADAGEMDPQHMDDLAAMVESKRGKIAAALADLAKPKKAVAPKRPETQEVTT